MAKVPLEYQVWGWHVHSYGNHYWIARYSGGVQSEYLVTPNGSVRRFRTYDAASKVADRLNRRDYPEE
jgi:hypothetical protein